MVRIAVRTLTLNVFGVDDPDLRKFITDKSAVPYFSNLTWFIRDQCIVLSETLNKAIHGPDTNKQCHSNHKNDDGKAVIPEASPINDADHQMNHLDAPNDDKDGRDGTPSASPISQSHSRSTSLLDHIKKPKRSVPVPTTPQQQAPQPPQPPTNQLQRGVEEQVDHYYYLEV